MYIQYVGDRHNFMNVSYARIKLNYTYGSCDAMHPETLHSKT